MADVAEGNQLSPLIHALLAMRLVTNFELMACTIFLWDTILTFAMEVDLIWKSNWNLMKALYLFQRYFPLTDIIWLVFSRLMGQILLENGCRDIFYFKGVFIIVGFVILTLRTCAVWKWNRHLCTILPILFTLFWGSSLVIMVRFVNSITIGPPPYPGFTECFLTHARQDLAFVWVLLLVWDAVLLALMLVPAIQVYRDGNDASLMKVVYRDGVIYYLYLFVLSCINIIIVKILSEEYQLLLSL
ncbi:hypothetical protein M413DRAFT_22042 [Hebeloma cylindrosporum]|uniref:DUF6533 domain-containing protein n=1 Tax=Hebeloma cylindrosporum TaxID=76867 RepID=A0A0C2YJI6_HEBCY|nr:hypothetical protein M413DRAFT_22042 [Hebeloma cylindrosporum h7]